MIASRPRLGVLGGSFDPPHLAHLAIASEAAHELRLERVLFVPAAAPPHKESGERTPAATRLELTELAVDDDLRFVASGIEIDEDLVYTRDTLDAVAGRYPGRDLVFLLGSDSLLQLETWHDPEALLESCTLAVAPRPGDAAEDVAHAAARWGADRITLLRVPSLDISSSDVRARVAAGRPIRYLVPRQVERRIHELGLYR
jgi:nicotinate-nucleotide adenylyltransferase